jgi:Xaa-Pro dipeptidase
MSQTDLYRRHLEQLDRHLTASLAIAQQGGVAVDAVLFHSGRATTYHRDDRVVTFRPTPHFFRWAPIEGPEHVVLATPGRKPRVVRVRPRDYWYDTSPPEPSYWEEAVDLSEAASYAEALAQLGPLGKVAYVGESVEAASTAGIDGEAVEPTALMAPLDWYRAYKTAFEVAQLQRAAEKAASGHQGAHEVFTAGGSEREIHWAFLESSDQMEHEVPYDTIVALESKGAILHYQHKRGPELGPGKILLIDAGASHEGYAADITRTWAVPDADPVFAGLINAMDALERKLVAMVTPGRALFGDSPGSTPWGRAAVGGVWRAQDSGGGSL